MAGKRQHFIPQFLQKGFASRITKSGTFTWVFRRGVVPFNTNIINVGEEGRFYTYDSDTEADDLITKAESEFSDLLHSIREGVASSLSDPRLPRMIAHLEIRTRHLRANLEKLSKFVTSSILDFVEDQDAFADKMKEVFYGNASTWRSRLAKGFSEAGIPPHLLDLFVESAMSEQPTLIDQQKSYFSKFAAALRPLLSNMLTQTAKSNHIEALKQSIAPKEKVEKYRDLIYKILPNTEKEPLILGDSVVLFRVDGVRPYKTYLDANDKLVAVYLPLDSARVLVGARQHHDTLPADLREAIAGCSLEHFIAAENTKANRMLQGAIGTHAALLTQEEIKAVINQVLQEPFH